MTAPALPRALRQAVEWQARGLRCPRGHCMEHAALPTSHHPDCPRAAVRDALRALEAAWPAALAELRAEGATVSPLQELAAEVGRFLADPMRADLGRLHAAYGATRPAWGEVEPAKCYAESGLPDPSSAWVEPAATAPAPALPRALRELIQCWEANDPSRAHIYELLDAWPAVLAELAAQQQPIGAPHVGEMAVCPECGPGVGFDEDGCCSKCGADTEAKPCKWVPVALDSELAAQPAPDLEAALAETAETIFAAVDRRYNGWLSMVHDPPLQQKTKAAIRAAVLPLLQAERARGGSREHGMLSTGLGRGSGAASDVSRLDAAESAPLPTGAAGENAGNNPQATTPEQPREPTPELRAAVVPVVHSAVVSLIDSKRLDPPATTDEIASMVAERVVETLAGFRWESAAEALRLRAALESARDTMTWFTIDHDERRVPGTLTCRLCEEKERATAALAQPASADVGAALAELMGLPEALRECAAGCERADYIAEYGEEASYWVAGGYRSAAGKVAAVLARLGLTPEAAATAQEPTPTGGPHARE